MWCQLVDRSIVTNTPFDELFDLQRFANLYDACHRTPRHRTYIGGAYVYRMLQCSINKLSVLAQTPQYGTTFCV